jgi:Ca2+-binding EF-hand superfamily protein
MAAFRALDLDSNGYLDSKEIYRPPFKYVSWMRLADCDGDGKVTAKEFEGFANLQAEIRGQVTFLRIESLGRSLYRLLDQDNDARLGARELNQAWLRLAAWDRGRGMIERGWLPQHFRLTLGYGTVVPERRDLFPYTTRLRPPRVEKGPLWFRKMDRNGDGDVSRKEWLGSAEQFRKIDSDGDGLISLEEAERADRWFRAARK